MYVLKCVTRCILHEYMCVGSNIAYGHKIRVPYGRKMSQQWLLQYFIGLKPASHRQILDDFCEYFRLDSRLLLSVKYVLFLDDNFLLGSFMQFILRLGWRRCIIVRCCINLLNVDFMNILTPKFCQILRFTYNIIITITRIMTRRLATCHVSIAPCFSKTEHAVYSSETTSLRQPIYTVLIGNRITVVFSFRAPDNISRTKSRLFYFRECSSTAFGTCC